MNLHLVHFHGPVFFLRPQQHYRDENEWREALRRFFESLARRDGVSSSRAGEPASSRAGEHGVLSGEDPDAVKNPSK